MPNNELATKVKSFKEIQNFIKQLEEEAEGLKAEITAHMAEQESDTMHVDMFTVKYTAYTSSRVDTTALKKELPEIAARYTKTTEARRFQVA